MKGPQLQVASVRFEAAEFAAGTTDPSFSSAEQVGLCMLESVVSLLATRTNEFGGAAANYGLTVFTTSNAGVGQAEIDGGVNFLQSRFTSPSRTTP